MELSIKTASTTLKVASKTYALLMNAHQKTQKRRWEDFSQYFETNYERMTEKDKQKINQFIESNEGEELLADYAESILKVSSRRVIMAMALLFCDEYGFTSQEKATFIKASKDLNDDLIDFCILAHEREKHIHENLPYAQCNFSNDSYENFICEGWDKETISIYVNELIKLRLLLPDPLPISGYTVKDNVWSLNFGVSKKTQKIVNLLTKSDALLTSTSS